MNITCSECVCSLSYLACKAHALQNMALFGLSGYTTRFTLTHKRHEFWGKILNTGFVFRFSLQILSDIFVILRTFKRDVIINVHGSSTV